ncbi:DUF6455 family protein [Phaeobacter sp. J2-8]|uniref:DUF6455 family protein n=1 Tax=Phaeobacter sp. J2-8 TaxID=2931394 RepID=UPI001FD28E73|nr:DUF6455 family protein [Phaeobacter sp. J2-8]MCJ7875027.1 DUF6455 family protein [Phaeobacter sp. J2-8]
MLSSEQIKRHAILMDRMGDARGLDMEEQVLRGKITSAELADRVLSCANCTGPQDCAHWLDTRTGVEGESPSYCRNADLFDDLSKR